MLEEVALTTPLKKERVRPQNLSEDAFADANGESANGMSVAHQPLTSSAWEGSPVSTSTTSTTATATTRRSSTSASRAAIAANAAGRRLSAGGPNTGTLSPFSPARERTLRRLHVIAAWAYAMREHIAAEKKEGNGGGSLAISHMSHASTASTASSSPSGSMNRSAPVVAATPASFSDTPMGQQVRVLADGVLLYRILAFAAPDTFCGGSELHDDEVGPHLGWAPDAGAGAGGGQGNAFAAVAAPTNASAQRPPPNPFLRRSALATLTAGLSDYATAALGADTAFDTSKLIDTEKIVALAPALLEDTGKEAAGQADAGLVELLTLCEYALAAAVLSGHPAVMAALRQLSAAHQTQLSTAVRRVMTLHALRRSATIHDPMAVATPRGPQKRQYPSGTGAAGRSLSIQSAGSGTDTAPSPSASASHRLSGRRSSAVVVLPNPDESPAELELRAPVTARRRASIGSMSAAAADDDGRPDSGYYSENNNNNNGAASQHEQEQSMLQGSFFIQGHNASFYGGNQIDVEALRGELALLRSDLRDRSSEVDRLRMELTAAQELALSATTSGDPTSLDVTVREVELMRTLKDRDSELLAVTQTAAHTAAMLAQTKASREDAARLAKAAEQELQTLRKRMDTLTKDRIGLQTRLAEAEQALGSLQERDERRKVQLMQLQHDHDLLMLQLAGSGAADDGETPLDDEDDAGAEDKDALIADLKAELTATRIELAALRAGGGGGADADGGNFFAQSLRASVHHQRVSSHVTTPHAIGVPHLMELSIRRHTSDLAPSQRALEEMPQPSFTFPSREDTPLARPCDAVTSPYPMRPLTAAAAADISGRATVTVSASGEVRLESADPGLQRELLALFEAYSTTSKQQTERKLSVGADADDAPVLLPRDQRKGGKTDSHDGCCVVS